jgi:pimeloyl-ACP methyl ester carboxylesterase
VIAESAAYRRQALDLTRVRVSSGWPAGLPVEVLSARGSGGQRSVAAQQQLTDLLGGRQTVLADSGHLMMMDQPQAIADAVWRVLRTIEQSA